MLTIRSETECPLFLYICSCFWQKPDNLSVHSDGGTGEATDHMIYIWGILCIPVFPLSHSVGRYPADIGYWPGHRWHQWSRFLWLALHSPDWHFHSCHFRKKAVFHNHHLCGRAYIHSTRSAYPSWYICGTAPACSHQTVAYSDMREDQ